MSRMLNTTCTCYACDHEWEAPIARDGGVEYVDVECCPECGETESLSCGDAVSDDREDFHADC